MAAAMRQQAMQYGNQVVRANAVKKRQSSAHAERNSNSRPRSSYKEKVLQPALLSRPMTARPETAKVKRTTESQKSLSTENDFRANNQATFGAQQMHSPQAPTPKQSHVDKQLKRPGTAKVAKPMKAKKQTKTDPVSRYQNMRNQWSQNAFLQSNGQTGRKLELDRFNKWR